MKPLCILIVTAACLAVAGPAAAQVVPEGTGEPAFTSSAQNTQWVRYSQPGGTDAYRLRATYYRDGVEVRQETVPVSGTGTVWLNWSGVATLEDGRQYGICVQGQYSFPNDDLYFPDGPNSCSMGTTLGKRTHTTIDRTKPTVSVSAAGGADVLKTSSIPVSMAFADATAGPFPSNFLCVQQGVEPCEGGYAYSAACSLPATAGKSTTFNCSVDASQLQDGPVTVCARAADAAVPDNPSSADQSGSAAAANLSEPRCDTVTLDRSVPKPEPEPQPSPAPQPGPGPVDPAPAPAPAPITGSGLATVRVGGVAVQLPKRVRLGKAKRLTLGARADEAGTLTVRLMRGKKVLSRLSRVIAAGDSRHRLRLPRRLKAGSYSVKIAFKPAGASWSAAGAAKVAFRR